MTGLSPLLAAVESELQWSIPLGAVGLVSSLLLGAVILILGILSTAGLSWRIRLPVGLLRSVAVVVGLLLLWSPTWRVADVTRGRDHVAVLVDHSASMALPVREGGPSRARAAARWLAEAAPGLRSWEGRRIVDRYHFDRSLRPGSPEGAPAGGATHLLESLKELRGRYRGRELAGVVVLGDGRDSGLLRAGVAGPLVEALSALEVPVNVVPLGGDDLRDVAVIDVIPDDLAFVRNLTRVRVSLRVLGHPGPVTVTLLHEGKPLSSKRARGGIDREVVFELVPERVGSFAGEIRVRPLEGEATAENNRRFFLLRVVRDRLRVLQIAGRPSWDVRFLRQHFKRDPNVDLVSFFILRTHLDRSFAPPQDMSLIEFPAEQLFSTHLPGFDLVVMQDFERYPPQVAAYLDNIAGYVRRGGGLAVVGGERSFTAGGLAGTQMARVLPVDLLPDGPDVDLLDPATFKPRWTDLARVHPVTRAPGVPPVSVKRLEELPPLGGVNRVAGAHPRAAVLATHPRLKGPDGKPAPVIALRDVDRGRVMAVMTDTLWRWSFGGPAASAAVYDAFWRRAVRYLIGDPEYSRLRIHVIPGDGAGGAAAADGAGGGNGAGGAGGADGAEGAPVPVVETRDLKRKPQPGVRFRWRVLRTSGAAAPGGGAAGGDPGTGAAGGAAGGDPGTGAAGGAGSGRPVVASGEGATDDRGRARLDLPSLPPGTYRAEARAVLDGREDTARASFVSDDRSPELARVDPDPGLLWEVARATSGRVLERPGDLTRARLHPRRITELRSLRYRPLWGSPWVPWALMLGALAGEWWLRRRHGLG